MALIPDERGQAAVWALLAVLVLTLVAAALVDTYRWTSSRVWAYHAAESAAERAVTVSSYYDPAEGEWMLNAGVALAEVDAALYDELALRGIDLVSAVWDVRVHPLAATTTTPGYPPDGDLWGGAGGWTTDRPSVAVYLELDEPTWLGGLAGVSAPARLHVFAASSLSR